jgi:hypothetical protein
MDMNYFDIFLDTLDIEMYKTKMDTCFREYDGILETGSLFHPDSHVASLLGMTIAGARRALS